MSACEAQLDEQVEACHHNLDHVDSSWLPPLGVNDDDALAAILASDRGRRSLTRSFISHYQLPAAPSEGLPQSHRWVLRGRTYLRALALRLGLLASAGFVRTSVTREALSVLHRTLGSAACRQAVEASLAPDAIQIEGLARAAFDAALQTGDIEPFLIGVGGHLLELALVESDDFSRMRLRYAFEADGESSTGFELSVDRTRLTEAIAELAGEF